MRKKTYPEHRQELVWQQPGSPDTEELCVSTEPLPSERCRCHPSPQPQENYPTLMLRKKGWMLSSNIRGYEIQTSWTIILGPELCCIILSSTVSHLIITGKHVLRTQLIISWLSKGFTNPSLPWKASQLSFNLCLDRSSSHQSTHWSITETSGWAKLILS